MGGTGGTSALQDPAGMGGSRSLLESKAGGMLPEWAAGDTESSWLTKAFPGVQMNDQNVREATTGTTGVVSPPVANLGFSGIATPHQVGAPISQAPASTLQNLGGAAPAPASTAPAAPAAPDPNAPKPDDWLYPGNLPMDFDPRSGIEFGKPVPHNQAVSGFGAAGNFGGVAGYGNPQKYGALPQMAAGAKLEGANVDQYNRVRRADYDRYMSLYGVGYDLPGYQQAINSRLAPSNFLINSGGPGG